MTEYVNFVNQYSLNQINQEFKQGFNLRLDDQRFSKEQIEENLTEAKKVQVENLTNVLDIAKKAGIKDFSRGNNISDSKLADGTYLYSLKNIYRRN